MARKLWINLYESYALHKSLTNPPKHFIVSLGWGHVVPMDDLLVTMDVFASVPVSTYDLIDPDLSRTALPMPVSEKKHVIRTNAGVIIECGDLAVRKISITNEAKPGTYQVVATTRDTFFTVYLDEKGEHKIVDSPLDEMKGVGEILGSFKYKSFAKAFTIVKHWTDPKPLGHDLELIPLTDLSDIHIGDPVSFQVTFMSKPFSCKGDSIEYITAASNTYGGEASGDRDGFFLSAYILNGKAQFRMPTAGQWLVNVIACQDVTPENEFSELVGKCTKVYYGSCLSFNVRP